MVVNHTIVRSVQRSTVSPVNGLLQYGEGPHVKVGTVPSLARGSTVQAHYAVLDMRSFIADEHIRTFKNGTSFQFSLSLASKQDTGHGECGNYDGMAATAVQGQGTLQGALGTSNTWASHRPVVINVGCFGAPNNSRTNGQITFNYFFSIGSFRQSGTIKFKVLLGEDCPTTTTGAQTCTRSCGEGYELNPETCTCTCVRTCGPGFALDAENCRCTPVASGHPRITLLIGGREEQSGRSQYVRQGSGAIRLSWTSHNASNVTLVGAGRRENVPLNGSAGRVISTSTKFTAIATNARGDRAESVATAIIVQPRRDESACTRALNYWQFRTYRGRLPTSDEQCGVGPWACSVGNKSQIYGEKSSDGRNTFEASDCADVHAACGCGQGTGDAPTTCLQNLRSAGYGTMPDYVKLRLGNNNLNRCAFIYRTLTEWYRNALRDVHFLAGAVIQGQFKQYTSRQGINSFVQEFDRLSEQCGCTPVSHARRCARVTCPPNYRLDKQLCECVAEIQPVVVPDIQDIVLNPREEHRLVLPAASGGLNPNSLNYTLTRNSAQRDAGHETTFLFSSNSRTATFIAGAPEHPRGSSYRFVDHYTYTATDRAAEQTASTTFRVFVRAVPPVLFLPPQPNISYIKDGNGKTQDIRAASGGSTPYNYTLTKAPAGVTLSGTTITIADTTAVGLHQCVLKVTDNASASKTRAFNVSVGLTPLTLPAQNNINHDQGFGEKTGSYALRPATSGHGTVTYSLVGIVSRITLSGTTIRVAANATPGTYNLTLRAEDAGGQVSNQPFTVRITRCPQMNWADYELDAGGAALETFKDAGYARANAGSSTVSTRTGSIPRWNAEVCSGYNLEYEVIATTPGGSLSLDGNTINYTLPADVSGSTLKGKLLAYPRGVKTQGIVLTFSLVKATKQCVAPRILNTQADTCECPAIPAGFERVPGTANCETRAQCSIRWAEHPDVPAGAHPSVSITVPADATRAPGYLAVNCYGERNITYQDELGDKIVTTNNGTNTASYEFDVSQIPKGASSVNYRIKAQDEHNSIYLNVYIRKVAPVCPAPQRFNSRRQRCECPPVERGYRRAPLPNSPCRVELIPQPCNLRWVDGQPDGSITKHVLTAELISILLPDAIIQRGSRYASPTYTREVLHDPQDMSPFYNPPGDLHGSLDNFGRPPGGVYRMRLTAHGCNTQISRIIEVRIPAPEIPDIEWEGCVKDKNYTIKLLKTDKEARIPMPRATGGAGALSYRCTDSELPFDPATHELRVPANFNKQTTFRFEATDQTRMVAVQFTLRIDNREAYPAADFVDTKTGFEVGDTFWFDKVRSRVIDIPQLGALVPLLSARNDLAGDTTGLDHKLVPVSNAPQIALDNFTADFRGIEPGNYEYFYRVVKGSQTLQQNLFIRIRDCDDAAKTVDCAATPCTGNTAWNPLTCSCECVRQPDTDTQYFDIDTCSFKDKPAECADTICNPATHYLTRDESGCRCEPIEPPDPPLPRAEPVTCALRWSDEEFNNGDLIQYRIASGETNIILPVAIGCADPVYYVVEDLSGLDFTHLPEQHELVIQPTAGHYQYRIVAISGEAFISAVLDVRVEDNYADSSPYPLLIQKDVAARPLVSDANPLDRPSKRITTHFAGILRPNNTVARLPGTIIGGYEGLIPGAFYGVDSEGNLARIPIDPVTGEASGVYFLRAVSEFEVVILPRISGPIEQ